MERLTYGDCMEITTLKNNLNKVAEIGAKYPGLFNMTIYQNAGVVKSAQNAFTEQENQLLLKYCKRDGKKLKKTKRGNQFIVEFKNDAAELEYLNERNELLKEKAGDYQLRKVPQSLIENMEGMQDVTPLPKMDIFFIFMVEKEGPVGDVKIEEPKEIE